MSTVLSQIDAVHWYDEMLSSVEALSDAEQSAKMSAYMKNRFPFLGVPKPKLMGAIKPYLRAVKHEQPDWEFVGVCWHKDWREAQYIALEYLAKVQKKLTAADLPRLEELITHKSWWETADTLDGFVGELVLQSPELERQMLSWSQSDNMWLRRVSIDYQQRFKERTNEKQLTQIIENNLGSSEFFINKAIGWSLREYSKTNPEWVRGFILEHKDRLDKLSVREASKYL